MTVARALVVEDTRAWQQILSEILRDMGLEVDVAEDVEAAMDALRAAPHRLAVVDLALGAGDYSNRDGLRVLDAVRRQDPGCVSLMLTGFATVEVAVSALREHGAFSLLRKETFNRVEFRELVMRALSQAPPSGIPVVGEALPEPPAAAASAKAGDAPAGAMVALVVEDDAGWRAILGELLADTGYRVRPCNSFGEALGCLRRERYDLAVVDLSLGGAVAERSLDGYPLLESTRDRGIPTLVVSAAASREDIVRAYEERGIVAYLEKQTFDRRAFHQAVAEAEASRRVDDELAALTDREREVVALLAQGMTNKEIAEALTIATNTVKRHLKAIYSKLDVHTRAAAAAIAVAAGVHVEHS